MSGGGVHNPVLFQFLKDYLGDIKIMKVEEFGIPSDAKEALAFAILANETICGNPWQCSIRYRCKGKGYPGKDNSWKVKRKEFNYR